MFVCYTNRDNAQIYFQMVPPEPTLHPKLAQVLQFTLQIRDTGYSEQTTRHRAF